MRQVSQCRVINDQLRKLRQLNQLMDVFMFAPFNRLSRGQRWLAAIAFVVVLLLVWFFGFREAADNRPPPHRHRVLTSLIHQD